MKLLLHEKLRLANPSCISAIVVPTSTSGLQDFVHFRD